MPSSSTQGASIPPNLNKIKQCNAMSCDQVASRLIISDCSLTIYNTNKDVLDPAHLPRKEALPMPEVLTSVGRSSAV